MYTSAKEYLSGQETYAGTLISNKPQLYLYFCSFASIPPSAQDTVQALPRTQLSHFPRLLCDRQCLSSSLVSAAQIWRKFPHFMFSAGFYQVRQVWGANILREGSFSLNGGTVLTLSLVFTNVHVCARMWGQHLCSCMWRLRSVPDIFLSFFLHCF